MRKRYISLGLMSGTSGDGVDASLIKSNGINEYESIKDKYFEYDANTIKVKYIKTEEEELISFDDSEKTYELTKFQKTNQRTCINIQPIVRVGDKVKRGQVLCHGYSTDKGELAIGRNFHMPLVLINLLLELQKSFRR